MTGMLRTSYTVATHLITAAGGSFVDTSSTRKSIVRNEISARICGSHGCAQDKHALLGLGSELKLYRRVSYDVTVM